MSDKLFVHGGRLGDCIYSLYAVSMLGGGIYQICLYHSINWNEGMLRSVIPLIKSQKYIKDVMFTQVPKNRWNDENISCRMKGDFEYRDADYDLIEADTKNNPDDFPELTPGEWPGNVHLSKRYAHHFGIPWYPESRWIDCGKFSKCNSPDVVFHLPTRRMLRSKSEWISIISKISCRRSVMIIGGMNDIHEWSGLGYNTVVPYNMLEAAKFVNSAKLFIGVASSVNAIAEGLKKNRLVELRDDCFNTYPYGKSGICINMMNSSDVAEVVFELT